MEKKIKVVGHISTHQWGVVIGGEGVAMTQVSNQHKWPQTVIKKWKRK